MEAHTLRAVGPALGVLFLTLLAGNAAGRTAGYRTANFTVDAPTPQLAKEIGDEAERCRRELAKQWLGKPLPNWSRPCPIKAKVAPSLGAGGATSFVFDQGQVFGWRMTIQGSRERILDSVLPHEVTHTIFASHFRQPVPRWADEGACTTVEHKSEIRKQENMLIEFLQTRRGIPFSHMFAMKEYPEDVLPLYAQGHSLSHYLISQRGKREFLEFLADGMEGGNWPQAIHQRYGYRNLLELQNSWMDWIRQGRPQLQLAANAVQVAAHNGPPAEPAPKLASREPVVRGQNPTRANPRPSASTSAYGEPAQPGQPSHGVGPTRAPQASAAVAAAAPVTLRGPTAEQLWPADEIESETAPPASIYDASRSTGTVRR